MTEQDARNFIDKMYLKHIGSLNDNETYSDDVVTILNKVTNSNSYKIGYIKNIWTILKNNKRIWEWVNNEVTSLYELLKGEILLFKLDLLNKE